jgi:ADP-ribose pyrophosphatase YjhB (NUDIX family)
MRPGWGARHPDVTALLARSTPVVIHEAEWPLGPLRFCAHVGAVELPREVVTSVRVIVQVDDSVVVCTNVGGSHPWPGGRLEPGESWLDAAVREVHEETGWHLQRDTVRQLGWLHCEHLSSVPGDHPFPHPDFLQYVVTGRATTRDGDASWIDTEGFEASSRLVRVADLAAAGLQDPLPGPFVELLT